MSFRSFATATILATSLALPAAAQSSTNERWDISPANGSDLLVFNSVTYDRVAMGVTGATVTVSTVNKTYTAYGKTVAQFLILQDGPISQPGDPIFVIDLSNLYLGHASPIAFATAEARCVASDQDGLCSSVNDISEHYLNDNVTATLQTAPTAVPTLTEWAMILMGTALAGAAALTLNARRRRV